MLTNTYISYGSISKTLHWLIFLLVLGMLIFGFCLGYVPDAYQGMAYNIHKLTGLTILGLVVIRLLWKFCNTTPLLPADTPRWQRTTDHAVQWLLYISLLCMPIAGWVGSVAMNKPPHLGEIPLRLPIEQNKMLAEQSFNIHNITAIVIIVLVSIHILAALYHYFIKKDNVLQRMLPESWTSR